MRRLRLWLGRAPHGMWACVLVAVVSSWVWALTSPLLQPPDEINHIGYVKYLALTGKFPRAIGPPPAKKGAPPPELFVLLTGIPSTSQGTPTYDPAHSRAVIRELDRPLPRVEESASGSAANNPPLYYVLEAIPYELVRSANLVNRILVLRLFSSLFAGVMAAFAFLFLRELVPRTPWAATAGGLAIALQPLVGFMGGSVNPDILLWAAASALFYASARILRHGLTARRALGLAGALAAGLATKGAMLGLIPGVAAVVAFGAWRAAGTSATATAAASRVRRAAVAVAAAAVAVLVPVIAWVAFTRTLHGTTAGAGTTGGVTVNHVDLHTEISYVWQFYLPKLPFQSAIFSDYPLWTVYFKGFVGRFGQFMFDFPNWVENLALLIAVAVAALAGRALWLCRAAVRRRLPELASYLVLMFGLLLLLGVAGYQFRTREGYPFEQTRYLLPLLPLYGGLLAVAARGAGRWSRELALVLVALAAAHDVFAVLLSISHYYA